VLPRGLVLRAASRHQGRPVRSLEDIGLNGITPREFRGYVAASGFDPVSVGYNEGGKPWLRALGLARRVPPLERFATVSIYAVLAKPGA
jgi:hypothetical protein